MAGGTPATRRTPRLPHCDGATWSRRATTRATAGRAEVRLPAEHGPVGVRPLPLPAGPRPAGGGPTWRPAG
eukprot:8478837-Alexandrium_andersonii.AAC.1